MGVGGSDIIGTYNDLTGDQRANDLLADFVRRQDARDRPRPAAAAALTSQDYPVGAKRVCLDTGYYETFNRDNVTLVNLRETPIEASRRRDSARRTPSTSSTRSSSRPGSTR